MKTLMKKNYHWIIAVVLFIELAIYGGLANNGGLFLLPVTEDFEITRGTFSLASSSRNLVSFFSLLISGIFVSRFGNRKMMLAGLGLGIAGYLLAACGNDIGYIAIAYIILGLGDGLCSTTAASRIVCDWFHKYQGVVLGITSAATGLGGTFVCLLLTGAMDGNGWRAGYICSAILVLVAGALVFLFIRSRPSDMDLHPYGFGYVCKKTKAKIVQDHWHGYTMQQLVRRPVFYLMLLATFLSATCIYLMFSVIVPHVQDHGLSASDASTLQGAMLTLLAVSKVFVGILSDKIGTKPVTILCMLAAAASLWMMADVYTMSSAWITLIIYGFALTLAAVIPPLLTNALFGYQAYSKCVGIVTAMVSLGGLVAAPISNMCFDRLGSYSPVFRVGAITSLVVTGLYLLLFLLAAKDRKKMTQSEEAAE